MVYLLQIEFLPTFSLLSTTSFSSTTSVVQTTSSTSEGRGTPIDTTTTPIVTTQSPERSSKRFRIFNSGKIPEAHLNQISEDGGNQKQEASTPDARVIELTNNILELKVNLELLKKELDM